VKRSEINQLVRLASACFASHGWALPPQPRWDVTDFGLGDWQKHGLVLVNLAEEKEYCEKLMYAQKGMTTPAHTHLKKKEDIISRWGTLLVQVWSGSPVSPRGSHLMLQVNGQQQMFQNGEIIALPAGHRVTLVPGVYHEFKPDTAECIIGEISTANDDLHDNIFANPDVGRFPELNEDEAPVVRLLSE
jgi:D-lyxose ketol-isomerase